MHSVLYLHGFASSPGSQKVASLRALLEPRGIVLNAPDLNVPSFESLSFERMVERAIEADAVHPSTAIAGSSLGALVALEVLRRGLFVPAVLIAPAIGVSHRWIERIPEGDPIRVFNHARNGEAPIHRAFFEEVAGVTSDREAPAVEVGIVMGSRDESVPFDRVSAVWDGWERSGRLVPGSHFVTVEGGDHGLTAHVELLADEIAAMTARGANRTAPL